MKEAVLVMGGSYFIGRRIVDALIAADYEVHTLNRGSSKNSNPLAKVITCDRNDSEAMVKALKDYRFPYIVDVSGLDARQMTILYDALDTKSILQYLFISSSAVYDLNNYTAPYREDSPIATNRIWREYGSNKIDAETYLTEHYGDRLTLLRPPYVYGPDNYAQRESFIFNHILNNKPIILPNNGETQLQFIYAPDLAEIVVKLLQNSITGIYNVGNKQPMTMAQWVNACEVAAGKSTVVIPFDYQAKGYNARDFFPFYDYDNVLDTDKIRQFINLETDFNKGLITACNWYKIHAQDIIIRPALAQHEVDILTLLGK